MRRIDNNRVYRHYVLKVQIVVMQRYILQNRVVGGSQVWQKRFKNSSFSKFRSRWWFKCWWLIFKPSSLNIYQTGINLCIYLTRNKPIFYSILIFFFEIVHGCRVQQIHSFFSSTTALSISSILLHQNIISTFNVLKEHFKSYLPTLNG